MVLQELLKKVRKPSPCIGCSENPLPNGLEGEFEITLCADMMCVRYKVWMKGVFEYDVHEEIHRYKESVIWDRPDLLGQGGDNSGVDRSHLKPPSNNIQNDRGHRGFHTADIRWADACGDSDVYGGRSERES